MIPLIIYIIAAIVTFFIITFLTAKFGSLDSDDILFLALLGGCIWPFGIPIAIILLITNAIGNYGKKHEWVNKWDNFIYNIRHPRKCIPHKEKQS